MSDSLWLRRNADGRLATGRRRLVGRQGCQALCIAACLLTGAWGCDSEEESSDIEAATKTDDGGAADTKDGSTSSPDASSSGESDAGDAGKAAEDKSDASKGDSDSLTTMVMTKDGPVRGEEAQYEGKDIFVFRGLPYAAPPAGDLRWKPPQPVKSWTDVRDATEFGDRSPQGESRLTESGEMSEDCLNLNVLTPAARADESLPVMVFFHGGGLSIGTGNSPTYTYTALPAQGVVVVTVNQRLGPFGYFSHPALAKESEHDSSGNYGALDQIAALKWVKANIASFGGDPGNVTIFGESGGGSKVLSCMASPLAEGLFHRAVIESGSRSSRPEAVTPREQAEEMGVKLAAKLGIEADDDKALEKLRDASWEDILEASAAEDVGYMANLSIDGWVLPRSVHETFAQGKQSDVPLIVGANEGESSELMQSVPELAASMKSVSSDAWVYVFSYVPPGWREPGCYAFHGLELAYVFGHLESLTTPTMVYLGMAAGCPTDTDPEPSADDEKVADNSMKIWAQFAKEGNPSVDGLIDWPAYTPDNDKYLDIGAKLEVKEGVADSGKAPGVGN